MKITSLTLKNFRCFGPIPVTIGLTDSTTLIGANGAGKSAGLEALIKLFGAYPVERRLVRSDFYLPCDAVADDVDEMSLFIEARIEFPELEEEGQVGAVPECFNQMIVAEQGGTPYCRVRLEGMWRQSSTPEGEIDEVVSWITTDALDPEVDEKVSVQNYDRARVQVLYVPAARVL